MRLNKISNLNLKKSAKILAEKSTRIARAEKSASLVSSHSQSTVTAAGPVAHGGAEKVFYHHYIRKTPSEQLEYFVIYSFRIRKHF